MNRTRAGTQKLLVYHRMSHDIAQKEIAMNAFTRVPRLPGMRRVMMICVVLMQLLPMTGSSQPFFLKAKTLYWGTRASYVKYGDQLLSLGDVNRD